MSVNLIIRECDTKDESAFVKLNLAFMQEVMAENPYWTALKMPTEEEMAIDFREALSMPDNILIFVAEADRKGSPKLNLKITVPITYTV